MSTPTQKIWQILPQIKEYLVKKYPEYGRVVLQLLVYRGVVDNDMSADARPEIDKFLYPDYEENIHDPFLFKDMAAAVEMVIKHLKEGNKICVYGDYDADGVTASAVLYETLTTLIGKAEVYIPDRVSEGYGLNKKAVKEIVDRGVKLIITVDTGIRNKEEAEYARELGLDIIITDHHVPPEDAADMPDCLVIDAFVPGEKYPFKNLAGVGVAWKLAIAVISKSKLFDTDKEKLERKLLDLVAIGTVADCVSLLGENRVLVKRGLETLNNTKRLGLNELTKAASLKNGKILESWNIGWQIAPRLNAAGRMDHANTAFELLITKSSEEAGMIVKRLQDRNTDRQKVTEKIVEEVDKQVDEKDKIIVGVCLDKNKTWNEGVIGLVAGRIADKYYRPTLVITGSEDGFKGSGRSIEEFNIIKAIEETSSLLEKYGGHAGACGFSLKPENLKAFTKKIKAVVEKKMAGMDLAPKIKIEAELALGEINEDLLRLIKRFEPFGQNNECPRFVSRKAEIVDKMHMGLNEQHLKLRIKNEHSNILTAIGFGQAERWRDLRIGDIIDIVYHVEMNEFNGRREAQLKIIDIKSHNS